MKKKESKRYCYRFIKRCFDIFSSFCVIVAFSLPLLILALIVKFGSKGPILFKDSRAGLNGKEIKVYKFRTMYIDAESKIDEYLTPEEKEIWLKERKIKNDPRITRAGKFLRKTSLDELPQLFNILFGSMSVVGPRPIAKTELEVNYSKEQQKILLSMKPGLISIWGVSGRNQIQYTDGKRQELELSYYDKRNVFYDFALIIRAVGAVITRKGAQ